MKRVVLNSLVFAAMIITVAVMTSCIKDAEYNEDSDKTFELSALQKILDGYAVRAIAFDSKGNVWIGTQGEGLIRYNENEIVIY
jgi:ligand-binding sensor domain-containing protein